MLEEEKEQIRLEEGLLNSGGIAQIRTTIPQIIRNSVQTMTKQLSEGSGKRPKAGRD